MGGVAELETNLIMKDKWMAVDPNLSVIAGCVQQRGGLSAPPTRNGQNEQKPPFNPHPQLRVFAGNICGKGEGPSAWVGDI